MKSMWCNVCEDVTAIRGQTRCPRCGSCSVRDVKVLIAEIKEQNKERGIKLRKVREAIL